MVINKNINIFEKYTNKTSLFSDKAVLQSSYVPEEILHREIEINQITDILAPAASKFEKPSNIFIYGKTGTGKTLSTLFVKHQLEDYLSTKYSSIDEAPLKLFYINTNSL